MKFLRSPLTWILLALGIWLNCEFNYRQMQVGGPDAVTTPMLAQQALIGACILVAIVCGVASASGDKFTWTEPGENVDGTIGKLAVGVAIIVVIGFALNAAINYLSPMEYGQITPAQYQPVAPDHGRGF